jgi:hypothetical protein
MDTLHADERNGGIEHHVHCSLDGFPYRLSQIHGGIDPDGIVQETFRGKGSPGETRVLEVL